jgi:hypothetical protein
MTGWEIAGALFKPLVLIVQLILEWLRKRKPPPPELARA